MNIVPAAGQTPDVDLERLAEALRGRRVAVLTGAGLSTESGIPDYRGEGTRQRARSPVQYREFMDSEAARRRYWARAVVGWPRFSSKTPNAAHLALEQLEGRAGFLSPITQNVDRLHQRAGSREVIELHGALAEVTCTSCRLMLSREEVQARLLELNPDFVSQTAEMAPDGDAELDPELIEGFELLPCPRCGGVLKPHVVFFGEGVPRERVERAFERVDSANALLVLGTSLAVFSGYRFVRRAKERNQPVHVVNAGPTRADPIAASKLEARLGELLPRLVARLVEA